MKRSLTILTVVIGVALLVVSLVSAEEPATPVSLAIAPQTVELVGRRARHALEVSGRYADATEADLSRFVEYELIDPKVARVTQDGVVLPLGNGTTEIVARLSSAAGVLEARVRVTVRRFDLPHLIDFRTEIVGALSRGGCNQGTCHGSPQGKNGFRLSLRGFNPDLDFETLTREALGRRVNLSDPPQSLVLRKPLGKVAHEGGVRFREGDAAYEVLLAWIKEASKDSSTRRGLAHLEVLPGRRYLNASSPEQQIVVQAHFDDGAVRDVTELTVFTSSDDTTATVSENGLVRFHRNGEVAILVRYLEAMRSARLTFVRRDPAFAFKSLPEVNFVDRHVFAKHRELQIQPAKLASDAVFLRRVYFDVIGSLPSPDEARAFLSSDAPDRRRKLIDELLERKEYAYFWAMKWADVMRGNRQTVSVRGVHSLHRYLVRQFAEDRPFDEFAREVLTSKGNTLHEPAANFFRIASSPELAAESMSQLFLGVRIQCAKCHNHPYESITQNDYYGLAAFFARVQRKRFGFGRDDEVIYLGPEGEVKHPATGEVQQPVAFGKPAGDLGPDDDLRERVADWLVEPDNPYFAKSTANRVWYHLFGRGIVEPVDDFRDSNPAANPELLDALARDFARGGYRVKSLIRTIVNSSAYQLSAESGASAVESADAERYFTRALVRMHSAEQILDAISAATGVPERFIGYPLGVRAIELAEGDVDHHFLKAFSRPIRDATCDCARETEPSLKEIVHLLNNPSVLAKLDSPRSRLAQWANEKKDVEALVELVYLATVSRFPTAAEREVARRHAATVGDTKAAMKDLQHALMNSNEFLLRH